MALTNRIHCIKFLVYWTLQPLLGTNKYHTAPESLKTLISSIFKHEIKEFPGGLVIRILGFQCPWTKFNPWWENWDPASCATWPKKEKRYVFLKTNVKNKYLSYCHANWYSLLSLYVFRVARPEHQKLMTSCRVACLLPYVLKL